MTATQLNIFIENKSGRLKEAMQVLKDNNINITALSLADSAEYGILRLICDNPEKAKTALRESGVIVKTSQVLALPIADRPGALADLLAVFGEKGIDIAYMYAFCSKKDGVALMVMKVSDPEKAASLLKETPEI